MKAFCVFTLISFSCWVQHSKAVFRGAPGQTGSSVRVRATLKARWTAKDVQKPVGMALEGSASGSGGRQAVCGLALYQQEAGVSS